MMFERDIHQTRVKNSSLCVRYFSVQARAIRFIYFLLERACQDAGHHGHKSRKKPVFQAADYRNYQSF